MTDDQLRKIILETEGIKTDISNKKIEIAKIRKEISKRETQLNSLQLELKRNLLILNEELNITSRSIVQNKNREALTDLEEWEVFKADIEIFFRYYPQIINNRVEKNELLNAFIELFPIRYRSTMNMALFRKKILNYCKESESRYKLNPLASEDGRIKSNGKEYYCISNENFIATASKKVQLF
jgi:hypothetical protein